MSKIRNEEVHKIMKGCIVINAVILFFAIQPFGSLIPLDTIIQDFATQSILAPALIGLLVPLGIKKKMHAENFSGYTWGEGSFESKFVHLIPKNIILRSVFWTILALVITVPSVAILHLFNVQEMSAFVFVPFKLAQAFIFCSFIGYFIITFTVTNFDVSE